MNRSGESRAGLAAASERGFTLTELLIAMMVFTLIAGAVVLLLTKSQRIFQNEQGVSEMDQNARLVMDFLTRDIQQSKENGLGLGPKFRSIYSYDGAGGQTDEITIVSSETETKLPSRALPLTAGSTRAVSALDHYIEVLPNGASHVEPQEVVNLFSPGEEFILSSYRTDGSVQFDFLKVRGAKITNDGTIGLSFDTVEHRGVQPETNYGEVYENGAFTLRPVTIKRYFVDRTTDKDHPTFALSINEGTPFTIARNVVAFQVRYLEVKDGELDGQWVRQQSISRQYKTQAVEVTMTARTEVAGDKQAERLVTLASVIRPRQVPGGAFGSAGGGPDNNLGLPGDGSGGPGGDGGYGGDPGDGSGGPGGPGGTGGRPSGGGSGSGGRGGPGFGAGDDGAGGFGQGGYNHETRRIGKQPRLGERLNKRP